MQFSIIVSEIFLHRSRAMRTVYCILITGSRPGGEWANTWHWTKRFTVFFSNRKE